MIVFSEKFINQWILFLNNFYKYETFMNYVVVQSLTSKKTLSYVPFLNYSDRLSTNINDLLELSKDNSYQIKVLNSEYNTFTLDDTVTMRFNIEEQNEEYIFNYIIKSKCRNQIRKSIKSNLECKHGINKKLIDDFYGLYSSTMHRYGTPSFSRDFFINIYKYLNVEIFVVYKDQQPISALYMLVDEKIVHVPWAASDNSFSKYSPSHLMYWEAIKYTISKKKEVFDFGRSGYGGRTYKFKEQWGAYPVKIDILKPKNDNIYNKYSLVSTIWKKLPKNIVNYIGPKICKYLVDL